MRFQLLGPVSIVAEGSTHRVLRAQTRGVLALFMLHADRVLSAGTMIEALWSGAPPSTARAQLHNAISDIRQHVARLGGDQVLVTERLGYRARVDPDDVDVLAFERMVARAAEAQRAGDHQQARRQLRAGLAMWTGEPLHDASGSFVEATRARLVDLRLTAIEDLAELDLRCGRPEPVAADLIPWVHEFPWRERLRVKLMTALYRSGRQSDALRCARDYRALLAEQEGLDPGREIVEVEATIRRGGMVGSLPAAPDPTPAPDRVVPTPDRPAQLPIDPLGFVAREQELAMLDEFCRDHTAATSRAVAIVGPGGAGKTALAVRWAYLNLSAFADGQLYIDLHGFGLGQPVGAFDALGQLLRGLGRANGLPLTVDERATLYRSMLSARRMLIVLDNAANSAQVRPLLPGVGPHATIITSRRRLDGLTAGEGVRQVQLDPMPTADAMLLLREHVDTGRVDDGALADVARAGAGLPLALRIIAARLAATPPGTVGDLISALADEHRRLATLSLPSEDTAVRSAFATSYHSLPPTARQVFRVLGLLPSPETSVPAWAAAAGLTVDEIAPWLDELCTGHLVHRSPSGRYRVHDLVRLFAHDLTAHEDPVEQRNAAERWLLEWYVQAANRADAVIRPYRGDLLRPAPTAVATPEPGDATAALAWFDSEAANILVAVERAGEVHPAACWQLAAVMFGWLERHQYRPAWLSTYETGSRAAVACADREALALMRQSLAIFHCHLEQYDTAAETFGEVLAVRREIGQARPIAATLMNLGNVCAQIGRDAEAVRLLTEARELYESQPDTRALIGVAWDNLGWAHRRARRYDDAIECHSRAAEIAGEGEDSYTIARAEHNIAMLHAECERYVDAERHWLTAIEHARRAGDRQVEADALVGRGRVYLRLCDYPAARRALTAALNVYESIDDRGTSAEVAELLSSVPV